MPVMDLPERVDQVAALMDEFGLEWAEMKGEDWKVSLDRRQPETAVPAKLKKKARRGSAAPAAPAAAPPAPAETGTPVTSPMMGVFYSSPSPGAAPFVEVGASVTQGQTVGLIEAMKVFNEIPSPASGTVKAIKAEDGQLMNPGDILMIVE